MLREIRRLPEAEVLRQWLALYVAGKHAGIVKNPDPSHYLGHDSMWVEVEIPHDLYDADWNTEDADLSQTQMDRALKYAAVPGRLPPGMASYRGRGAKRGRKKVYVSDGNHRAYAAYLRGDPAARFYMPLSEWLTFRKTVEGDR
jgi:hypothetical protein